MWTARTSKVDLCDTGRGNDSGPAQDLGTDGSLFKTMGNFNR